MLVRSQTAATKNIFHGYLDTSLDIGFLSFLLQKCISHIVMMRASSKKQNGECNTMGKL